jgi:recombination protein RecA
MPKDHKDPKDPKDPVNKEIKDAWQEMDEKFGKGSVIYGKQIVQGVMAISTGSLRLDIALGIGGVPRGRITEIFGPESSGKTTLVLEIIKNVQRSGGHTMFVDAEHALDITYANKIGVNMDKVFLSQPDYGEQALAIVERFCKTDAMDAIIVDSVAGLVPKAELDGEIGDQHMGAQARMMSQTLRKLAGVVSKSKTALIFTNQIREKLGVFFGNNETTPGGRALKFYASVRIDIRRISTMKKADVAIGNIVRAKVQKNKVAPPFRQAEFEIVFGRGINASACILDLAEQCKLVTRSGSWYVCKGEKIGNGHDDAAAFLDKHPEVAAALEESIRKIVAEQNVVVDKPPDEGET